jgi:hypothetical protein
MSIEATLAGVDREGLWDELIVMKPKEPDV